MADPPACARHDRIEEQLRRIRSDMDWLRQQDVAILRQLVTVKRAVEDIVQVQPPPSRQRLFRSATVSVKPPKPPKRSLSSQSSNPIDGGKTTRPRDDADDAADGNLNPFASEGHFPANYGSDCSGDDDDDLSPLSRSYGAEGVGAALGAGGAGGSGAERQQQLSRTQTANSWLSSSFYEEMLRRNVKIWKTVQLINTERCDANGVKLWS